MPTATTTTTKEPNTIELSTLPPESPAQEPPTIDPPPDAYLTTTIPDGGYGWTVVLCASMTAFLQNGILNCWGVLQAALLSSTLSSTPPSTVSFIGSLGLAGGAAYGLIAVRFMRYFGSRAASILGVLIMALSLIGSAECTGNVGGLFGTNGVLGGVGMALVYAVCNALPVQYFSGHLGFANGLVKLGGGIGGCVMAVALEALNAKVGIAWTFRVQGFLTIAVGLPAAWFLRDRVPLRGVPFVDLHMFKSGVFAAVFAAGAVGTFALFVPPYFLPLFAQSVGMSSGTGAGLVAAFNACNAVGRFVAGPLCDKIGPVNMLMITTLLNAVSMLAIWPVSDTLGPLFSSRYRTELRTDRSLQRCRRSLLGYSDQVEPL
ncbi:MFS general substrate transporter [Lojkania enalia]|uniref:MFS general substrate transporter n=1 Tax=Lojkania enalia TaxID=147567 RepID=A0A9P4KBH0_9PLEO|nr:MFS general substrate transporter [Didymosphaeria enalia]